MRHAFLILLSLVMPETYFRSSKVVASGRLPKQLSSPASSTSLQQDDEERAFKSHQLAPTSALNSQRVVEGV